MKKAEPLSSRLDIPMILGGGAAVLPRDRLGSLSQCSMSLGDGGLGGGPSPHRVGLVHMCTHCTPSIWVRIPFWGLPCLHQFGVPTWGPPLVCLDPDTIQPIDQGPGFPVPTHQTLGAHLAFGNRGEAQILIGDE